MLKARSFTGLGLAGIASIAIVQPSLAQTAQITAVQLQPTANGVELILESTSDNPLQVFITRYRQTRNISDVVLRRTEFTPINIFNPVYGSPIPTDLPPVFDSITLPSFVRADAAIFYRRNNYRAAVNFKNLFGTDYYEEGSLSSIPVHRLRWWVLSQRSSKVAWSW